MNEWMTGASALTHALRVCMTHGVSAQGEGRCTNMDKKAGTPWDLRGSCSPAEQSKASSRAKQSTWALSAYLRSQSP
jgi:hypothetical protein